MNILLYDLEITPALAWTYEMYDTNVIEVERPAYIMCFSYKWYGEKKVHVVAQPDFDMYEDDPHNDYMVVYRLWELMDKADVVVAHNANKFDNKIAQTRFLMHGFVPPSPYKTVDTLTSARRFFRVGKNSLDYLCQSLDIGRKPEVTHGRLWHRCVNGDMMAWQQMKRYCKHDVELLDGLYTKLRPFITNHPNVALMEHREQGCPRCGSLDLQSRGTAYTNVAAYSRYYCKECGAWSRQRKSEGTQPEFVNA